MNVASLELCKKLYELSEWDDVSNFYAPIDENISWHIFNVNEETYYTTDGKHSTDGLKNRVPAYDLGYLLRKLPPYYSTYGKDGDDCILRVQATFSRKGWYAYYNGPGQKMTFLQISGSPEDAAIKLAIELFKSGVLTKEKK